MSKFLVLLCVCGAALAAGEENQIHRETYEWCDIWVPHSLKTDLPHVLLIGDSIVGGYYNGVNKALEGKAYVAKIATSKSLGDPAYLDEVEMVLKHTHFDVIHFNNGLHGQEYTDAQYRADFSKLLKLFKKRAPHAKLIWRTSTPWRKEGKLDEFHAHHELVLARNKIAAELVAKEKLSVDDLYALVVGHPEYSANDGVHYNATGTAAQAAQVSKVIESALK